MKAVRSSKAAKRTLLSTTLMALCLFPERAAQSSATRNVMLTSSLNADSTVHSQETVNFTCETRGSGILEWSSEEYIGAGGQVLQFIPNSCSGQSVRSSNYPNAEATCLSATRVDGQFVIVSQLTVVTSASYPTSTVSCSNNGGGSRRNITFQTTTIARFVTLNSTLNSNNTAYSQETVIFICETRGSGILEWSSEEYIGIGGQVLQFLADSCSGQSVRSSNYPNAEATCLSAAQVDGQFVIVSQLTVVTSASYPTSTVSCSNNGGGSRRNITFQTTTIDIISFGEPTAAPSTISTKNSTTLLPTDGMDVDTSSDTGLSIAVGVSVAVVVIICCIIGAIICVIIIKQKCCGKILIIPKKPSSGYGTHGTQEELQDQMQQGNGQVL